MIYDCIKMTLTCRLQDLAGYGVGIAASKVLRDAFPDRTFRSPVVELLVKSGRNGNIKLPTIIMNRSLLFLILRTLLFVYHCSFICTCGI